MDLLPPSLHCGDSSLPVASTSVLHFFTSILLDPSFFFSNVSGAGFPPPIFPKEGNYRLSSKFQAMLCIALQREVVISCLFSSVQFSSVAQSCLTLCDPMNHSMPGLPVHHQLLEFTQTQVHRVSDAIQPSHPLSSPSPPAPNPSQHQSFPMSQLFARGGQSTAQHELNLEEHDIRAPESPFSQAVCLAMVHIASQSVLASYALHRQPKCSHCLSYLLPPFWNYSKLSSLQPKPSQPKDDGHEENICVPFLRIRIPVASHFLIPSSKYRL